MTERNALCSLQLEDVTADFTAGTQEFFSILRNFDVILTVHRR